MSFSYSYNYSYSDVIPQDLQDRLIAIRDNLSQNFWDIGDIALMICNYADDNHISVSRDFIWSAVGSFVGLAARTVRDYARVAKSFGYDERDKYDILTFSHFSVAARYPEKKNDILEYAIEEAEKTGKPASVDKLEVKFTFNDGEGYQPPKPTYEAPSPRGDFFRYVSDMKAEVGRLPISEEYRHEIREHLNAIERLLKLVTVYA